MTLVFWQGIVSIHQQSFLEAVAAHAAVSKVLLVVAQDMPPYRESMGWHTPSIAGVEIVHKPSRQQITEIVSMHLEAVHIMGGIRVGPMLAAAFDACVRGHCRLGIMTESYDSAGLKGSLRTVKYQYYRVRYFKYIQFVLAIGRQGADQYSRLGFNPQRIFPWAYFITVPVAERRKEQMGTVRLIYAGRLEPAKGIYLFTEALLASAGTNYRFDIYGSGPDEEKLKQIVAAEGKQDQIHFHPFLQHGELLKRYANYDWVVLPSTAKDGWGVIVSEGLLNGLKALCSNICGVSQVIKEGASGVVFDWSADNSCEIAIEKVIMNEGFSDPAAISSWAENAISAAAGTSYFMHIMNCVYDNKKKPALPWESPI